MPEWSHIFSSSRTSGDVQGVAQTNLFLEGVLRGLLAVAGSYPALKANQNFLELQLRCNPLKVILEMHDAIIMQPLEILILPSSNSRGSSYLNMAGFKARKFYELGNQAEAQNVEVKF